MTQVLEEGATSLDTMIVRAAESIGANVAAARTAIGEVIYGQERVVDQGCIVRTHDRPSLCGRWDSRVRGPRPDQA